MFEWVYGNIATTGITLDGDRVATGSVANDLEWKTAAKTTLLRFDQREFVDNDQEW